MELHYKCTIWCKLKFNEDVNPKDIIEKLEKGYLPLEIGYDDIIPEASNTEWEVIDDTEEFMSVEENDGQSTIELMEEGEVLWDNSYESELKRKQK